MENASLDYNTCSYSSIWCISKSNADSYGDCNVAILSFWIILIYLSVLRVAYNLWMLLQAGLFSCCYLKVNDSCDTIRGNGADLERIKTWDPRL